MDSQAHHQHLYHDENAQNYERERASEAKWQREQAAVASLLARVATATSTIVDVPVGTGRFFATYAEIGCPVTGIDISEDMLAQARANNEAAAANVTLSVGDITALALDDDSVDVALCVRFCNLVDFTVVQRALGELGRVSRGHVVVGVRLHERRGWARRIARKTVDRVQGRQQKLTIHSVQVFHAELERRGLSIVEKAHISDGLRRSSDYSIYLLQVGGARTVSGTSATA